MASNPTLGPTNAPQQSVASGPDNDSDYSGRRVRLRPKPAAMGQILGYSPLLAPLQSSNGGTNGMVWPYQPVISYQQDVDYQAVQMVHTNQEFYAYTRTNAVKFTCEGEFSVQNQAEGRYALACLHFLRTVTKMYFGASSNVGTPPPVLLFDALGQFMFNKLPVIVTSFSANMPKDVDYVPVDISKVMSKSTISTSPTAANFGTLGASSGGINGKFIWLPAVFTISVSMTVQNTPEVLRTFNLQDFRNGTSLRKGGWV